MDYNKHWEVSYTRDRAHGIKRYVRAEPTRRRLQMLLARGVPARTLANATGLSDTTIRQIVGGHRNQVQSRTAHRVLQLRLRDVYADTEYGLVPSVGALRRVCALRALGWDDRSLAAAGAAHTNQLLAADRDRITIRRWHQIAQAYAKLSMTLGPSRATRQRAQRMGWAPPLAWDDEAIDEPWSQPQGLAVRRPDQVDEVAIHRAMSGDRIALDQTERVIVVTRMAARSLSDSEIAVAIQRSPQTVLRMRKRIPCPADSNSTPGAAPTKRSDACGDRARTVTPLTGTLRMEFATVDARSASPDRGAFGSTSPRSFPRQGAPHD